MSTSIEVDIENGKGKVYGTDVPRIPDSTDLHKSVCVIQVVRDYGMNGIIP